MYAGIVGLIIWLVAFSQWAGPYKDLPHRSDRRFRAVLLAVVGLYFVAGFWS